MKIISWNVNGIRAVIKKGFLDFLKNEKADVLCLQEIKISETARHKEEFDFPGYVELWNSAERPGYSGTMMLVKDALFVPLSKGDTGGLRSGDINISSNKIPLTPFVKGGMNSQELIIERWLIKNGLGIKKFDSEGRVQTLDLGKFYLVNTYFPNANHELSRLKYKLEFNNELLKYLKKLEKNKPVIICGDMNVAHQEIDLARPKENVGNPGFTYEEREWMDKFTQAGFVDTFREINGEKVQYSWWSYRAGARRRNVGWRIDYFCASAKIAKSIKKSFILDKITGSDHCPVGIEIKL